MFLGDILASDLLAAQQSRELQQPMIFDLSEYGGRWIVRRQKLRTEPLGFLSQRVEVSRPIMLIFLRLLTGVMQVTK